ncbi:MAG: tryptophan 7-halogenase [Deltaproteobacteria bacterium]|nr:tryptophan 7-halogenase [Deltaproteobacteria bacterium]
MTDTANTHWDVLIVGGGFAGQCQARHLLRNVPGLKIALIEPRTVEEIAQIRKIGESTVEIAATFMGRELGLYDYLIENHQPKVGLAFHWPKDNAKTDSIGDYASLWPTRNPTLPSWQVHRGKLESDLMQMNLDDGVEWIQGTVVDMDLPEGKANNSATVNLVSGETVTHTCDHLVDAAGRAFLTGKAKDNMLFGPKNLFGLKNGAAWVRVRGVDRKKFVDGIDPDRTVTSQYYATNHFFGPGHWLWMIPISMGDTMQLSVGVMYHHQVIKGRDLDTEAKFMAFLKANHEVLYNLINDRETEDFVHWVRPSHYCKQMFSPDRWYAMGDAAYFGDAFYSQGTSTIAFAVESVTELIKSERAGQSDAEIETKRDAYDRFNLWWGANVVHLYRDHHKHLGNPGVMSWRVYLEYMWWFGAWVPTYLGKFFLDPKFVNDTLNLCQRHFFAEIYDDMNKLVEGKGNKLPLMDPYRADQLAFGYEPPGDADHWLENVESEPQRLNVFRSISRSFAMCAVWWMRFQITAFGMKSLFRFRTWKHFVRLLGISAYVKMGEGLHHLKWFGKPKNDTFAQLAEEVRGMPIAPTAPRPWLPEQEPTPETSAA